MISELIVSHFRSLGPNVRLKPGRLSILIGPNGSGKSNVLDVLSFVRDAVIQGLPAAITHRGGIANVRRRSHGRPFDVHIDLKLSLDFGPAQYAFVITGDRLEEYKVKSEKAIVYNQNETYQFQRNNNDWEGPEGVTPRMDEQSLALTALGGTTQFKPLVDFLSGITVYSIFPDTLRGAQRFDSTRPMKRHGDNWVSILRELVREQEAKKILSKD